MRSGVDEGFDVLLDELESFQEKLRREVQTALEGANFEEARKLVARAEAVVSVIGALADVQEKWRQALEGTYGPQSHGAEIAVTEGVERPAWGEGYIPQYAPHVLRVLVDSGGSAASESALLRIGEAARRNYIIGGNTREERWRSYALTTYHVLTEQGLVAPETSDGRWAITDAGRRWLNETAEAPPSTSGADGRAES